jgi:anti-anti-sigma factor
LSTQAHSPEYYVSLHQTGLQEDFTVLRVTVDHLGETVILHCTGRIVRGHETAILCAAVNHRGRKLVLDLSKVDAIDAAGIGALISLQAAGIYLQLLNPTKAVCEVLRVTNLDSIFEIRTSSPSGNQGGGARRKRSAEMLPSPA